MIFRVGGSAGGVGGMFTWSAEYNDQGPGTVTISSSGPSVGRGLALVRRDDGRQAAIHFLQDPGGERLPLPAGADAAVEVEKVVNSPDLVISPARARAILPNGGKGETVGGFEAVTYWTQF